MSTPSTKKVHFIAVLDVTYDINNSGNGLVNVTPGLLGITDGGFDGFGEDAASHELGTGLKLGTRIDAEIEGYPSDNANGDNQNASNDEDGFGDLSKIYFIAGEQTTLDFTATLGSVDTGYLNAWIDFNQDGVFSDGEQVLINEEVTETSDRQVTLTVPIEALNGETYLRFRLSSQKDIDWYGPAPDGEVEDYKIEIRKGDATISGYAFHDRNFNTVWDEDEAGQVGVVVYVDLDNDGTLNYDDINNNGVFDLTIDIPTERMPSRWTTIRARSTKTKPATTNSVACSVRSNRTSFAKSHRTTRCQPIRTLWLLYLTVPMVTMGNPDATEGNQGGYFTIFLEDGELLENANFGNFEKSHIVIEDVVIAEGDVGYTDVELTRYVNAFVRCRPYVLLRDSRWHGNKSQW